MEHRNVIDIEPDQRWSEEHLGSITCGLVHEAGYPMKLWRPVGLQELQLVYGSGMKSFPPRLADQPIFYPTTTFEYADEIASVPWEDQ
jgi:hypothetical protein